MNHTIYADDTALLATSPAALQKLLDIAAQFINEREPVANMKKTKCMAIKPKYDKALYVRTFYLNGKVNKTTSKESYLGVDITDDTTVLAYCESCYCAALWNNYIYGYCFNSAACCT